MVFPIFLSFCFMFGVTREPSFFARKSSDAFAVTRGAAQVLLQVCCLRFHNTLLCVFVCHWFSSFCC